MEAMIGELNCTSDICVSLELNLSFPKLLAKKGDIF